MNDNMMRREATNTAVQFYRQHTLKPAILIRLLGLMQLQLDPAMQSLSGTSYPPSRREAAETPITLAFLPHPLPKYFLSSSVSRVTGRMKPLFCHGTEIISSS